MQPSLLDECACSPTDDAQLRFVLPELRIWQDPAVNVFERVRLRKRYFGNATKEGQGFTGLRVCRVPEVAMYSMAGMDDEPERPAQFGGADGTLKAEGWRMR